MSRRADGPPGPLARRDRRGVAVALARQRVARDPGSAAAHVALAHALIAEGGNRLRGRRATEATAAATAAVRLAPDAAWAHHALGTVALARGADRKAEAAFRAGLARDPMSAILHNDLGVALHRQGLRREAVHAYGEASQLDPHDSLAHDNARTVVAVKIGLGIAVVQVVRLVGVERYGWGRDDLGPVLAVAAAVLALSAVSSLRRRMRSRRSGLPRADRSVLRELRRAQRRDDLALGALGKVVLAGWAVLIVLVAALLLTLTL